jgi:hypothetical protein
VDEAVMKKGLALAIARLIHGYLQRVAQRFARLAKMARDGRFEPPRKRKPLPEGTERPKRRPRERPLIRMSGSCWIARHAQGAALAGYRLHMLLDDAAFIALIGLDPRFPAMLRPLCAALATAPEPGSLLALAPKPPRPKRPRAPQKPRVKKVRWKCAKPPHYGLEFTDPTLNLWYGK